MPVPPPAGTSFTVADPHAGHFFPVLVGKRSGVLTSPSGVTLPVIANAAKSLMVAPLGDKLDANANRQAGPVQVDLGPLAWARVLIVDDDLPRERVRRRLIPFGRRPGAR
jgi:hypothetical protein